MITKHAASNDTAHFRALRRFGFGPTTVVVESGDGSGCDRVAVLGWMAGRGCVSLVFVMREA
jgi:hypothetical protein